MFNTAHPCCVADSTTVERIGDKAVLSFYRLHNLQTELVGQVTLPISALHHAGLLCDEPQPVAPSEMWDSLLAVLAR